jgi:hypothetical protein
MDGLSLVLPGLDLHPVFTEFFGEDFEGGLDD